MLTVLLTAAGLFCCVYFLLEARRLVREASRAPALRAVDVHTGRRLTLRRDRRTRSRRALDRRGASRPVRG